MLAAAGSRDTTPAADSRRWLLLSFAGVWLFYAVFIGGYLRRQERTLVGYELALRRGEVQVQEMSEAPFGYLGWKLFNTAKTRGADGARLADFLKYVEGGRSGWREGRLIVDREGGRKSIHPSREIWRLPETWRDRPFPLSDEEWRMFLNDEPTR